jgi:hypothetical protein
MGSGQQALLMAGAAASASTPSGIANIWEWWEPSREGLANNDPIGTLTGQVSPGGSHDFTQPTGARQPIFIDSVLNGLGIARFTAASTHWMNGVNANALTAIHFFVVVQIPTDPPATTQVPWRFGTDFTNPDTYPFTTGSILSGIGTSTRKTVGNPTPSLAAWRVFEVVSKSGNWTAWLDGSQIFTTASNTVSVTSLCSIGANTTSLGVTGGNPWDGDIAGIYIFSAQITGTDRTAMVTYLNSRWGLSIV